MKDTIRDIGWSVAEAARRAGVPLRTMERWAADNSGPAEVEAWLWSVRDAVRAVPAPPHVETLPQPHGRPRRGRNPERK